MINECTPQTESALYRPMSRGSGNRWAALSIHFRVRGRCRNSEIRLTSEYPRQSPVCRVLTPIFHPNIEPAVICVGDHWTAAERLTDLVIRIGEMIAYQTYNIQSPLDGEAAMWADLNRQRLPIDSRDLYPADSE